MDLAMLERRAFPRTQAFVPITYQFVNDGEDKPAYLLDLSSGGASLMATAVDAPSLGQYIYVKFEALTNDGAKEAIEREELAAVVHICRVDSDIVRAGV